MLELEKNNQTKVISIIRYVYATCFHSSSKMHVWLYLPVNYEWVVINLDIKY